MKFGLARPTAQFLFAFNLLTAAICVQSESELYEKNGLLAEPAQISAVIHFYMNEWTDDAKQ